MAKGFQNVAKLSALAGTLPVQRPPEEPAASAAVAPVRAVKAKPVEEGTVQISLRLRKSLARQLDRLALDADMTKRAFVLDALRERGLKVTADDLADARKGRA